MMTEKSPIAQNVQNLIDKLHLEGVEAGRDEGEVILEASKKRAALIIEKAQKEAAAIKDEMHQLIEDEKKASNEAMKMALRDAVLTLKTQLSLQFKAHLQNLISYKLADDTFLEEMLMAITRSSLSEKEESLEIIISEIEDSKEKQRKLIKSIASDMFRHKVRLGKTTQKGIKISLIDEEIEIDLTEEALTDLIYHLLIPRYHELLEGIEK
jgi:V/A-type H+-transporting ATPase subunit E